MNHTMKANGYWMKERVINSCWRKLWADGIERPGRVAQMEAWANIVAEKVPVNRTEHLMCIDKMGLDYPLKTKGNV